MSLVYVGLIPQGPLLCDNETILAACREVAASLINLQVEYVLIVSEVLPETGQTSREESALLAEVKQAVPACAILEGSGARESAPFFEILKELGWQGEMIYLQAPASKRESQGKRIGRVLNEYNRPCALLACGHLSRRMAEGHPSGIRFNDFILRGLKKDTTLLRGLPVQVLEEAEQNIYHSLLLLLGAREGSAKVLGYEVLDGTGYIVAEIYRSSPVAGFARTVLTHYLSGEPYEELMIPGDPVLRQRAGCFVTLKKEGDLRGCIGTLGPTRENLAAEIKHNVIKSATQDYRFWPVDASELPLLTISVDVLSEMEKIESSTELDPLVYGVVVQYRSKTGLLLPRLEGIDDAEQQVDLARQKAGIWPEEQADMWRFTVDRYFE